MNHKCYAKTEMLLVWGREEVRYTRIVEYLKNEFEESLTLISSKDIELILEVYEGDALEKAIESYDFHVLRFNEAELELCMVGNKKLKFHTNFEDKVSLEDVLDEIGRELIKFRFEKNKKRIAESNRFGI